MPCRVRDAWPWLTSDVCRTRWRSVWRRAAELQAWPALWGRGPGVAGFEAAAAKQLAWQQAERAAVRPQGAARVAGVASLLGSACPYLALQRRCARPHRWRWPG